MWDNMEDAFKELDANEFNVIAKLLADYKQSLLNVGFSPTEAKPLVENLSKFIYNMSIEQFIAEKKYEALLTEIGIQEYTDEDVDSDDESGI